LAIFDQFAPVFGYQKHPVPRAWHRNVHGSHLRRETAPLCDQNGARFRHKIGARSA
jgi:hypothetical protein